MHHALQLAEITLDIRCFLEVKDLKQCILVCRDCLIRHRQEVRSLENFEMFLYCVPFNNLRSIVLISGSLYFGDLTPWIRFLRGCEHSLQELDLEGFRVLPPADFWETPMDLPRFSSLKINHGWIEVKEQARAFWSLCSKLETLKLRSTRLIGITDSSLCPLPDLSNMKGLFLMNVNLEFERQALLVARCDFAVEVIGRVLSDGIKSLEGAQDMPWSPKILATVHEFIPKLTWLYLDYLSEEGRRLALLLLASCPNLRTVTTQEIKVSDMVALAPQGWACARGLSRLNVYFEVDEVPGMDREESNHFVLDHRSTLTELEMLHLNSDRYYKSVNLGFQTYKSVLQMDWTDLSGINEYNEYAEKDLEDELHRRGLRSDIVIGAGGSCTKLRVLKLFDPTDKKVSALYTDPSGKIVGLWRFVQANTELETLRVGSSDAGASVSPYDSTIASLKDLVDFQDYTRLLESTVVMERYPDLRSILGSTLTLARVRIYNLDRKSRYGSRKHEHS
ncbi:hypothetical protein BGX24_006502 [Mortierella sp. AD032]|nr:hypothetical protein BGX24_006502 [Mortierella sp. AD032]